MIKSLDKNVTWMAPDDAWDWQNMLKQKEALVIVERSLLLMVNSEFVHEIDAAEIKYWKQAIAEAEQKFKDKGIL